VAASTRANALPPTQGRCQPESEQRSAIRVESPAEH